LLLEKNATMDEILFGCCFDKFKLLAFATTTMTIFFFIGVFTDLLSLQSEKHFSLIADFKLTVTQQQQLSHFPSSHFNLKMKLLFVVISRKSGFFSPTAFFQFFCIRCCCCCCCRCCQQDVYISAVFFVKYHLFDKLVFFCLCT